MIVKQVCAIHVYLVYNFSDVIKIDQIDIVSNMTEEDIYESFDELDEFEDHDIDLDFWLEGVLLLSVACFGLIGNIALVMIFTIHRNKIRTFHRYVEKGNTTFWLRQEP